ncbi:unnamed protein product [Nezara viridula]|uniref:Neuropeptide n=1 Tax=Nezara viridula TaxID=85310 RepID=A0A9P0HM38_NEZVI|nr:unnamed protein product [Nezara viridula]
MLLLHPISSLFLSGSSCVRCTVEPYWVVKRISAESVPQTFTDRQDYLADFLPLKSWSIPPRQWHCPRSGLEPVGHIDPLARTGSLGQLLASQWAGDTVSYRMLFVLSVLVALFSQDRVDCILESLRQHNAHLISERSGGKFIEDVHPLVTHSTFCQGATLRRRPKHNPLLHFPTYQHPLDHLSCDPIFARI